MYSYVNFTMEKKWGLRKNKQLIQVIVTGWDWNLGMFGSNAHVPSTLGPGEGWFAFWKSMF